MNHCITDETCAAKICRFHTIRTFVGWAPLILLLVWRWLYHIYNLWRIQITHHIECDRILPYVAFTGFFESFECNSNSDSTYCAILCCYERSWWHVLRHTSHRWFLNHLGFAIYCGLSRKLQFFESTEKELSSFTLCLFPTFIWCIRTKLLFSSKTDGAAIDTKNGDQLSSNRYPIFDSSWHLIF